MPRAAKTAADTPTEDVVSPTTMTPEELAAIQKQNELKERELDLQERQQLVQEKALGISVPKQPTTDDDLRARHADWVAETNESGQEEVIISVVKDGTYLGKKEVISINGVRFPFVVGVKNTLQKGDQAYTIGFRKYPNSVVETAMSVLGHGNLVDDDTTNVATRNEFENPEIRKMMETAQAEGRYYETPTSIVD